MQAAPAFLRAGVRRNATSEVACRPRGLCRRVALSTAGVLRRSGPVETARVVFSGILDQTAGSPQFPRLDEGTVANPFTRVFQPDMQASMSCRRKGEIRMRVLDQSP